MIDNHVVGVVNRFCGKAKIIVSCVTSLPSYNIEQSKHIFIIYTVDKQFLDVQAIFLSWLSGSIIVCRRQNSDKATISRFEEQGVTRFRFNSLEWCSLFLAGHYSHLLLAIGKIAFLLFCFLTTIDTFDIIPTILGGHHHIGFCVESSDSSFQRCFLFIMSLCRAFLGVIQCLINSLIRITSCFRITNGTFNLTLQRVYLCYKIFQISVRILDGICNTKFSIPSIVGFSRTRIIRCRMHRSLRYIDDVCTIICIRVGSYLYGLGIS